MSKRVVGMQRLLNGRLDNGIVGGYGNDLFGPKDLITREQMAVMLNNYIKYKGIVLEKRG